MKILLINSVYKYGSTGRIVDDIKQYMSNQGHEVYVIYGRSGPFGTKRDIETDDRVFFVENPLGLAYDVASSVLFDSHGLHSKNNTKRIIDLIKEINPDIVHLHNIHGFYINYQVLFEFLKNDNRPVIWTLHDCWSFTGFCSHYLYNGCDQWKHNNCKHCKFRNVYPYRIFSNSRRNFQFKMNSYAGTNLTLVTVSKWLQGEVQQSLLKNFPSHVIHNDVNTEAFYYEPGDIKRKYGLENKRIYLCCASTWTKQKGFNECIALSKFLSNEEHLVMIGLSETQIKKLPENILGITYTNVDGLRYWYSECDAFFNPTFEETFSIVNLEASMCLAPVITYKSGGTVEAGGEQCVVVPKSDFPTITKELRKANRENIHPRKMDEKSMFEKYLELYNSLAKETKDR